MCDADYNIQLTWQLVSQFVSWDFCRFMCEQNESNSSEMDVLTFLRNMIVQRTEKSISDITKHEIIAKFIMESKTFYIASRIPSIVALSESVKRICPELEPAIMKTIHLLKKLSELLESNENDYKPDLIRIRIEDSLTEFCKEASRLLPQPELLQVIGSWNHHHAHKKPSKKVVYSAVLFEKVLECLHFESVAPSEARIIALSLREDKVFEKILKNAEAESETEADSEAFSQSVQSSQPNENVYSQEFLKNAQYGVAARILAERALPNLNTLKSKDDVQAPEELPARVPHVVHVVPTEHPPSVPVAASSISSPTRNHHLNSPVAENDRNYFPNAPSKPVASSFVPSPPNHHHHHVNFKTAEYGGKFLPDAPSIPATASFIPSPQSNHHVNFKTSECDGNALPNETDNDMQFAQSSENDSDSDEQISVLQTRINLKYGNPNIRTLQVEDNDSDSDTSDCEKNAEYRFLTPTMFKAGTNTNPAPRTQKVVWLSDQESNDSTVITSGVNSQEKDPSWSLTSRPKNRKAANVKSAHRIQNVVCVSQQESNDSAVINAESSSEDDDPPLTSRPKNQRATKVNPARRTQNVCLSEQESNDSPATNSDVNSKENNHSLSLASRLRNLKAANNIFEKPSGRVTQKKSVRVLSDSDSSDSGDQNIVNNSGNESENSDVYYAPSDYERPFKKRRLVKKLYRSPNISLNDFVQSIRKPNPVISSGIPIHRGTNTPSVRRKTTPRHQEKVVPENYTATHQKKATPAKNTAVQARKRSTPEKNSAVQALKRSTAEKDAAVKAWKRSTPDKNAAIQDQKKSFRRQKCKHCKKTYKTVIALRRHIFLKHTTYSQGESDIDCDD